MLLAEEVGSLLRQKGWTIAVAESCTGGKTGDMITSVPGSSDYFLGGVISYSDDAKVSLHNGTAFGPSGDGHMRILTATSKGIMNEALDRIERVIPKLEKMKKK